MKKILFFCWMLSCIMGSGQLHAQILAFPGAEGFGRYATGGRSGSVYHVTSLNDDGRNGTFRKAVEADDARIVVFDVSGTIHLNRALSIKGKKTILGQTAPGDGICVADYPVTIDGNNVIVRYMRFRLGNKYVANHEGDGLGSMDHNNIIIDHCSVSWSIDECISVYGGKNLTVQWCIAAQSLKNAGHSKGAHGYGGNWGGSGASYHHNLIVHNESRTPRLGPRPGTQTDERMDMRNNVIYNWGGEGCYGGEGMNVNIVNNYYKPGPCTSKSSTTTQQRIAKIGIRTTSYTDHDGNPNQWDVMWHKWGTFYVDGNYNSLYSEVTNDNWTYGMYNQISNDASVDYTYTDEVKASMKRNIPVSYEGVTTHSAKTAYERVLSYAGASLHRDALDDIMISDTRNGTATMTGDKNAPGIINTQDDVASFITGSDSPWPTLTTNGSPLSVANEAVIAANGYTNIENAANALVADITVAQNADGIMLSNEEVFNNTDPKEYSISPSTNTGSDGTTWSFSNGYTVTNDNSKTYSTGSSCGINGIKISARTQFTIHVPSGIQITAIDFTGATNYTSSSGTSYVAELNGTSYGSTEYVFPAKDSGGSGATHHFTFDEPITDQLTFTIAGVQIIGNITLYGKPDATGIRSIKTQPSTLNAQYYYTLDGRRLKGMPTKRGIYIYNGKRFVIR